VAIVGSDQYYPQVRNLDLLALVLRQFDVSQAPRSPLMERLALRLFGGRAALTEAKSFSGCNSRLSNAFEKTENRPFTNFPEL
jgi:hypothetical protein